MCKYIVFIVLLIALEAIPQNTSTLFQIINSNSSLNTPSIVREMQNSISDSMKGQQFGLNVSVITDRIINWKNIFVSSLESTGIELKFNKKDTIWVVYKVGIYGIKNTTIILTSNKDEQLRKSLFCEVNKLDTILYKLFDQADKSLFNNNTTISNSFYYYLTRALFKEKEIEEQQKKDNDIFKICYCNSINELIKASIDSVLSKIKETYKDSSCSKKIDKLIKTSTDSILSKIKEAYEDSSCCNTINEQLKNSTDSILSKIKKVYEDSLCYKSILISLLKKNTIDKLKEEIITILDKKDKIEIETINQLNKILQQYSYNIKQEIINGLNEAEFSMNKAVQNISNALLSSNIGIGLTEAQGNLEGGIHFLGKWLNVIHFGFYLNGQLTREFISQENNSDSTNSNELLGLYGLQIRINIYEKCQWLPQLDLLASSYTDKKLFRNFTLGAGITFSRVIYPKLMVGLNYIYDKRKSGEVSVKNSIIGLALKWMGESYPSVLIGWSWLNESNFFENGSLMIQFFSPIPLEKF